MNRALLTSKVQRYGTPELFHSWLDESFRFTVDVCADRFNHKHVRYFDEKKNGLAQSWEGETAFMNPPYAQVDQWMEKARWEALTNNAIVVCLVPSRTDTKWWKRSVMNRRRYDDRDAGPLQHSAYVPANDVLWLRWGGLITGIYHHDQRLDFEEDATNGESAPFPSAVVIQASINRRPSVPSMKASEFRPSLLLGWPRQGVKS